VSRPMKVLGLSNFDPDTVLALDGKADVLVMYSRTWEPTWGALRSEWIRQFLSEYYFYKPQVTREQIQERLGLNPVARWEERGQWIEVYARTAAPHVLIL
jgi:hypothetical protein